MHRFFQRASDEYEKARIVLAEFIRAPSAENVAMMRNTTEGINIVANALDWRKGDKIVMTVLEHHSNFITWLRVARRHGCRVEVVKPDAKGRFDMADLRRWWTTAQDSWP